ncbi:MAG: FAD-binding oxidoreductase [Thermomicrobium sp.]|nr:FAD-binding oxidoreductase [Thermomicrobium sp.]
MPSYDVLIVGGGNLGLWTAYHLAKRGMQRIAVCERYWAGFGATTRSAGIVRQQGGSETAVKLGKWSRELYLELGRELGLGSGFVEVGHYVLASTPEERAAFQELVALRQRCGVENTWLEPDDLARRVPFVDWSRYLGATYTPNDGFVYPYIAARNITYAVLRAGVALFEECEVQEIEALASGYRVRTTRGTFEAERVVNAAGPRGARRIGELLGIDVPVSAARHQIVSFPTRPPELPAGFPMLFVLAKGYYLRPDEHGVVVGMSNPEEQPDPTERFLLEFDWDYFERLKPDWEAAVPALRGLAIGRSWTGSIDYTPDHLPIIDEPRHGFYVLAAGGHGMMWGPALGLKMAELILDERVSELPAEEIRLDRFREPGKVRDAIALPFPTR